MQGRSSGRNCARRSTIPKWPRVRASTSRFSPAASLPPAPGWRRSEESWAPILGGYPGIDFDLLPLAFVVVIVGGMGSLKGALIGSVVVGLIDNFGKALVPELSYFTLFAPMVIVLAIKPTGLYGRA